MHPIEERVTAWGKRSGIGVVTSSPKINRGVVRNSQQNSQHTTP